MLAVGLSDKEAGFFMVVSNYVRVVRVFLLFGGRDDTDKSNINRVYNKKFLF